MRPKFENTYKMSVDRLAEKSNRRKKDREKSDSKKGQTKLVNHTISPFEIFLSLRQQQLQKYFSRK